MVHNSIHFGADCRFKIILMMQIRRVIVDYWNKKNLNLKRTSIDQYYQQMVDLDKVLQIADATEIDITQPP